MRFISRSQAFKKGVIKAQQELVNTDRGPEHVTTRRPYIAIFEQGGATPRDKQLALDRFQFKGAYEREDVTRRISIFDTDERASREGWSPEFKKAVEDALVKGQNTDYFLVEDAPAPLPWPAYNETEPELVGETARLIGVSFDQVLAYERQNQNRPAVIKALTGEEVLEEVEVEA